MSSPPLTPDVDKTPVEVDKPAATLATTEPGGVEAVDKPGPVGRLADAPPPGAEWPLWEIFVRSKAGLDHKHCGSLHAADPKMAIQLARDVYTRRQEGVSIWAVRSDQIVASDPGDKAMYFDPMEDKVYRHPTFYPLPAAVDHM